MDAASRPLSRTAERRRLHVALVVLSTLCLGILLCSLLLAGAQAAGHPAQALDGQLVAPFRWFPLAVLGL